MVKINIKPFEPQPEGAETWMITGEKALGYNSYGMTVREVYDNLPDNFNGSHVHHDADGEEGEGELTIETFPDDMLSKLPSIVSRYRDAIDWLDENYAYFLTHVLNIGHPVVNNYIPTAMVFYNKKRKRIEFHINPNLAILSVEEFATVLAHETMHVRLKHTQYLPRFYAKEKDPVVIVEKHKKANIAADIVINDYLDMRGFDLPLTVPPNVAQCGMSQQAAEALQKFLEDNPDLLRPGGKPDKGNGQTDQDQAEADDAMGKANGEKLGKGKPGPGETLPKDLQDVNQDTKNDPTSGVTWGHGNSNEVKAWAQDTGTSLAWGKLLNEINPDMFTKFGIGKPPRKDFHRPHRGLAFFPDVNLPVKAITRANKLRETDEIPEIVLALDTSGSCSHLIQKFITLAKSVPQRQVKLWVCTFSDSWMELNLDDPQYISSGTRFSAIEQYIKYKMKEEKRTKYPSTVVVVSDGEGQFSTDCPEEKYWDNWYWLLDGHYRNGISDSRAVGTNHLFKLADYIN